MPLGHLNRDGNFHPGQRRQCPLCRHIGRWAGGSTRAWRKTRAVVLQRDNYTCTTPGCNEPATEVHHIDDTHLRSVCRKHNPRGGHEAIF
jgi:5-methylcytosine-specific restriction endonuclease McrA